MLSLKIAFFAFLSFATLALAIPTSDARGQYQDPKAAISSANVALQSAVLPLCLCCLPSTFRATYAHHPCIAYVTHANVTSDCLESVIDDITVIVFGLIGELRLSSLSACGCSANEIVGLIAVTLEIILNSLYNVYILYPGLVSLLGQLIVLVVELLEVVLTLVGGLVGELVFLLIGNGCAGVILKLNLSAIIHVLGLGGLLGII
ncbi:hypothetical protein BC827DRAFT_804272 [Russula dissimulans]|nr:hypothetical protein BC827DRAFT_804272 [Russula dissimulans]